MVRTTIPAGRRAPTFPIAAQKRSSKHPQPLYTKLPPSEPPPPMYENSNFPFRGNLYSRKSRARLKYEASINTRPFICERQVSVLSTEGLADALRAMDTHGIEYMFDSVPGYDPTFVREFYTNLCGDTTHQRISTTVQGKGISLDSSIIAEILNYQRPNLAEITYPRVEEDGLEAMPFPFLRSVRSVIGDHPTEWPAVAVECLNEQAALLSKIIHYNIYPIGDGEMLHRTEMEILTVLISEDEQFDIAGWIFHQLRTFPETCRRDTPLPFPYLITKICEAFGYPKNQTVPQEKGPIRNAAVEKKVETGYFVSSDSSGTGVSV